MNREAVAGDPEAEASLPAEAKRHLRDLLLVLADNKRMLGIRYSDCMLGSPSLETGIAASSMAQDEWGHGRLTYALLADFGDEPKHLEHERESGEYTSIEFLDDPFPGWSQMIAAALLFDTALTVQYEALRESAYAPVRQRVQKLLDEELLHFQYAAGWANRLAHSQLADDFRRSLAVMLPACLRWFGPPDWKAAESLVAAGACSGDPDELRRRYLERLWPTLSHASLAAALELSEGADGVAYGGDLSWEGWDEVKRRSAAGGPDPETLSRVRGDLNRAMLLE
jgi:ring-1,2-phenylacetyl-CoA epoxidase subunit PaaC